MIGTTIANYRIIGKLGEGGMGVVYKAEDTRLERTVALKFLRQPGGSSEEERSRFVREAKAAAALEHPNICTVYEFDAADGQTFIAMACVEGPGLHDEIAAGPIGLQDALDIAIQVAEGLQAAHEKHIVHRDIKPANILLTDKKQVKITDFGLAKSTGRTVVTREGTTLGTVAYMSPEQARGEAVDHRTDLWALGAVLYQMITGRAPFCGDYDQTVLYSILNENPEPITGLRTGVPLELERIVQKALAKDPDQRYQHADDMLVDLRALQARDVPSTAVRAEYGRPRRKALFRIGGILVLLMALFTGAMYYFFRGEAERPERIPIAVIDFFNDTDESELNGLSGMLITALEQSRRLSVLTRARMFDILEQLQIEDVPRIDENLGREICRQAGINLMAIGSIRKFGSTYTVDLKVLDRRNNSYVITADGSGEGQESIPGLIDQLVERTRKGLKEVESEIKESTRSVASVTTLNLEAYQHFFKGEEFLNQIRFDAAIEEFLEAVRLDSSFGLAHYRLGYAYHFMGRNDEARIALQDALSLLERIPEKEQYLTRAYAAHLGHSDEELEEGLSILRDMELRYPDDKEMIFFIGDWSYHRRQYETSLTYLEKVLAMDPTFGRALVHLTLLLRDTGNHERMLEIARRNNALGENAFTRYLLGSAHGRLGHYEQAIQHLTGALAMERDPIIYHEMVYVYNRQGSLAEAEAAARAALALDQTDVWSLYVLCEVLLRQQRASEAETLARAFERESQDFHSRNLLARILVAGDVDVEKGLSLARDALDDKPIRYEDRARTRAFFPLPEHTIGLAHFKKGRYGEATRYLEQATALSPLRMDIHHDLQAAREKTPGL